jgi:exosortase/archaeosortase family protein
MPRFKLSEAQRFGIRFFAILILMSVLSWVVVLPNRLGLVQRAVATSAAGLARLVGSANTVDGDQILVHSLSIDISFECTGIYVLLILFTFLLAYPASWRARVLGAAIGTAALTLLNILRISFLVRVAELQPALFEYLHEYVWQGLFLVLVITYAMTWVRYVQR